MKPVPLLRWVVVLLSAASGCASSSSSSADAGTQDALADQRLHDTAADSLPGDVGHADQMLTDSAPLTPDQGSAMDTAAPVGDAGPATALRINEVYVDRDLSGDKVEFVEIIGPVGQVLDGIRLRLIDSSGTVDYELALAPAGATIGSSGLWTVGGNSVSLIASPAQVDQVYSITTWGLDNTAGAVQLVQGSGSAAVLLDVVGYGAALPTPASPPLSTAEGTVVTPPTTAGQSIGRRATGVDSGDNAADFCTMSATPGHANGSCL